MVLIYICSRKRLWQSKNAITPSKVSNYDLYLFYFILDSYNIFCVRLLWLLDVFLKYFVNPFLWVPACKILALFGDENRSLIDCYNLFNEELIQN